MRLVYNDCEKEMSMEKALDSVLKERASHDRS